MPARFERHRKTKWEWGTPGSRSAETRTAASPDPDPARKAPAKKDTRRWCRGKEGAEHDLAVVLHSSYGHKCGWWESGRWVRTGPVPPKGVTLPKWHHSNDQKWVVTGRSWSCLHEYQCQACGKYLGRVPACPDRSAAE